ncbi:uncharacterized protein [Watersipora subatra]|uniref:uncharacterized protein n=1 Tax=Watersipora subatra TaxID=2589382 RepID=UPI00355C8D44
MVSAVRWLKQADWMRLLQLSYIFEVRTGYETMKQKIEVYRDETEQLCDKKVSGIEKRVCEEIAAQKEAIRSLQSYIELQPSVKQMIECLANEECSEEKLKEAQMLAEDFGKACSVAQSLQNCKCLNDQPELEPGDSVKLRCKLHGNIDQSLEDDVTHMSVGILHEKLEDSKALVIFPENVKWKGSLSMLEKSLKKSELPYVNDPVRVWATDTHFQWNEELSKESYGVLKMIDSADEDAPSQELVVYVEFSESETWKGLYKELLDPRVWKQVKIIQKRGQDYTNILAISDGNEEVPSKETTEKRPKQKQIANGKEPPQVQVSLSADDLRSSLQKTYEQGKFWEKDFSKLNKFAQRRASRLTEFKKEGVKAIRDYKKSFETKCYTKIEQEKVGAEIHEREIIEYIICLEAGLGNLALLTFFAKGGFDALNTIDNLQATILIESLKRSHEIKFWNDHVRRIAYGVDSYWEPKGGDCIRLRSDAFTNDTMQQYIHGHTTLGSVGILMRSYIGEPEAEVLFPGDKAPWMLKTELFSKVMTKRRIPFLGDKVRLKRKAITLEPQSGSSQSSFRAVHGILKAMFPEAKVAFGDKLWTGSYADIELVPGCGLQEGDKVCIRRSIPEPVRGWGGVTKSSVGKVVLVEGEEGKERITVEFPECKRWVGVVIDLELVRDLREADEVQFVQLDLRKTHGSSVILMRLSSADTKHPSMTSQRQREKKHRCT